jgi:hypothetical protein
MERHRPRRPLRNFSSLALPAFAWALGLGAWSWSCAAGNEPAASTVTSGTAGTGGAGGSGAAGQGGLDLDAGQNDGPLDEDAACVKAVVVAKPIPLDIAIAVDRSGSMNEDGKWTGMTGALKTFINDPASAGIGVGLSFFPFDPDATTCDYHDYEKLLVPIAPLPMNAGPLFNAITMTGPGGNTPMFAGLKGVLLAASAQKDANPGHAVIVLLASDGLPGSCKPNQNHIADIVPLVAGAHAYNGLETYVIALSGTDVDSLSQLAAAGGTTAAYDVTADVGQLSQKLNEIRGAAIACDFLVPAPPAGEVLDPEAVNVEYFASGQSAAVLLPQAAGPGDCAGAAGWYYDSGTQPLELVLCPASCEAARSDPGATLKLLFGCSTQLN